MPFMCPSTCVSCVLFLLNLAPEPSRFGLHSGLIEQSPSTLVVFPYSSCLPVVFSKGPSPGDPKSALFPSDEIGTRLEPESDPCLRCRVSRRSCFQVLAGGFFGLLQRPQPGQGSSVNVVFRDIRQYRSNIYIYIYIHICTYIYIYIYI